MKRIIIIFILIITNTFSESTEILSKIISYKDNPIFSSEEKEYLGNINHTYKFGVLMGNGFLQYNSSNIFDGIRFLQKAMEKYFGLNIHMFYYKNKEDLLKALKNNEVDYIISGNLLLKEEFVSSAPILKENFGIFYTKDDIHLEENIYIETNFYEALNKNQRFLKETDNIHFLSSDKSYFNLIHEGKSVFDSYFNIKNYLYAEINNIKFKSYYSDYVSFLFSNKFDTQLMKIINKSISNDFGDQIKQFFEEENKRNKFSQFLLNLTEEEKDFIKNNPTLKVYLDWNYFPISFYDEKNKKFDGFFLDVLKDFTSFTGQEIEIINKNKEDLNLLRFDSEFPLFILKNRNFTNQEIISSPDHFSVNLILIGNFESRVYTKDPMDYIRHNIAYVEEEVSQEIAYKFYGDYKTNLVAYKNYEDLLKALEKGDIQYGIVPEEIYKYYKIIKEKSGLKSVALFESISFPLAFDKDFITLFNVLRKTKDYGLINYSDYFNKWDTYAINYEQELASKNVIIEEELEKQKKLFKYISFFTLGFFTLSFLIILFYKKVKELNKNLHREKYYEPITGVPNKRLFLEEKEYFDFKVGEGILCLAIVNQNELNQIYTFEEGENLQKEISDFLSSFHLTRIVKKFYFINGIYVIILKNSDNLQESAELIKELFKDKFEHTLQIKISYAIKEKEEDTFDKIFDQSYFLVNSSISEKILRASENIIDEEKELIYLSKDIPRALKDKEIIPFFQAKISSSTGKITGVEALARWIHKEKGIIPPYKFIEKAEQNGNIISIDLRIAELAIASYKNWMASELVEDNFILSFNLSPKTLNVHNIDEIIIDLVRKHRVNPENIEVEITERVVIENYEHFKNIITRFREIGILVAIDDFSAGNASLDYILKIDFTTLKIDRSLLNGITKDNHKKTEIYKAIVEIGKKLNMRIIAEGVENLEELRLIRGLEVDEIQGYYYSKPIKEEDFIEYIKKIQ